MTRPNITKFQESEIKRAAKAAYFRHLASKPRPLHPDAPAEDEAANGVSFSALYGCSLMVMSLSALVVRAASLFSGKPQSVEIFRDEASARFGLAAFRRTLQKTPEGRLIRR